MTKLRNRLPDGNPQLAYRGRIPHRTVTVLLVATITAVAVYADRQSLAEAVATWFIAAAGADQLVA